MIGAKIALRGAEEGCEAPAIPSPYAASSPSLCHCAVYAWEGEGAAMELRAGILAAQWVDSAATKDGHPGAERSSGRERAACPDERADATRIFKKQNKEKTQ